MSVHSQGQRVTVPQLVSFKGSRKIAALTAYTAPFARLLDEALDLILVGDSTAMVGYALPDTLSVSAATMAGHAAAVVRATQHACIVVDMPFRSGYQQSPAHAFAVAAEMVAQSGASAVKFEGGVAMAETTRFLVDRGIPVMAHVGLMPQYLNTMGGFKAQGLDDRTAGRVLADAQAQAQAGAFSIVLEGMGEPLAREITNTVSVPTIGIGASPDCDGQILVTEDILGLSGDRIPKFAQRFADAGQVIRQAVEQYAQSVREGTFPTLDQCFGVRRTK